MSVTTLARYGTTEVPAAVRTQRRKDRHSTFKMLNQERAVQRRKRDASKALISFDADEAARLVKLAHAGVGQSGSFWSMMALDSHREGGLTQVRVSAEQAKLWASWMRSPGVDGFGPALAQIEAAAGRRAPEGKALSLSIQQFREILVALEGDAASGVADAPAAAQFLRTARFERGLIYVYLTPERAARLAEVFVVAGITRGHIVALDRLAGRPEPRAF
nr:hypothetical protein NG677_04470 [Methylobacterium sp. OTU13CASTA1]